jgi:hypothetical protein
MQMWSSLSISHDIFANQKAHQAFIRRDFQNPLRKHHYISYQRGKLQKINHTIDEKKQFEHQGLSKSCHTKEPGVRDSAVENLTAG